MGLARGFTDELKSIVALPVIGAAKDELLDAVMNRLEQHFDAPLRIFASATPDANLNIAANKIELGDGAARSTPPAEDIINSFVATTVNFQTGSVTGGTVTVEGSAFAIPASTAGQFRRVALVYQSANNRIDCIFSDEAGSVGALTNPGELFASLDGVPVGYLDLEATGTNAFKTAGSASSVIENKVGTDSRVFRFGGGTGTGSGGRTDFKLQSISSNVATIKKGFIVLDDGRILVTYDGADQFVDVQVNLKTQVRTHGVTAPNASTTYYLYLDLQALSETPTTYGDTDLEVYNVEPGTSGPFVVLAESPENVVHKNRYVHLASLKTDGSSDYVFGYDLAGRRHVKSSLLVSPLVETIGPRSIGAIGAKANAYGPLENADFPNTTNLDFWHFDGDVNSDGPSGVDLTVVGSVLFNRKGLFGRENVLFIPEDETIYVHAVNSFFNIGSSSFYSGGWFRANWEEVPTDSFGHLLGIWDADNNNRSWAINIDGQGGALNVITSTDGLSSTINSDFMDIDWKNGELHHLAFGFDGSNVYVFVDGKITYKNSSASLHGVGEIALGIKNAGSASRETAVQIEDFFFHKGTVPTVDVINSIYSKRFSNHNQIAGGHVLDVDSFSLESLLDKISFWNFRGDSDDGSVNAHNLTEIGTVNHNLPSIDGQLVGPDLSGVNGLVLNDSFINPGHEYFGFGGWFHSEDWEAVNSQFIFAIGDRNDGLTDLSIQLSLDSGYVSTGKGQLRLDVWDETQTETNFEPGFLPNNVGWNHFFLEYLPETLQLVLYINGVEHFRGTLPTKIQAATSDWFGIASRYNNGAVDSPLLGTVASVFFTRLRLTEEDLRKLRSAKIDLSDSSLDPTSQLWIGNFVREDGHVDNELPKDWLLDKRRGKIYVDFGENSGDKVQLKLHDNNLALRAVPSKGFDRVFTSDPSGTIAHNLPAMPTAFAVLHDELGDGQFAPLGPENHIKADETNLYVDVSALTVDATHPIRIIAIGGVTSLAIGKKALDNFNPDYVQVSGAYTAKTGDQLLVDTSGGAFTVTLPATPAVGDRVVAFDSTDSFDTNNLTLDPNGSNMEGAAGNYTADLSGRKYEAVYVGGSKGWKVYISA